MIRDLILPVLIVEVVSEEGQTHADAPIVSEEAEACQSDNLPHVVVYELGVVRQHVGIVALRFVGESESGEVECGDEIVVLQELDHLPEVETRRRIPVQHNDRRIGARAKRSVRDLDPLPVVVRGRGSPLEPLGSLIPLFCQGRVKRKIGLLSGRGHRNHARAEQHHSRQLSAIH